MNYPLGSPSFGPHLRYPFEVPLVIGAGGATGVVLADQLRSLDWVERKAKKQAWATVQCVADVASKVKLLLP